MMNAKEELKKIIIDLVIAENPDGWLLDEAEWEANSILYRKDIYDKAIRIFYDNQALSDLPKHIKEECERLNETTEEI